MSELEFIDIFGDNLKSLLEEVGISQNQLAEEAEISKSIVSRYVNKEVMPSTKNLINICYCLDCPLEELVPTYELIR